MCQYGNVNICNTPIVIMKIAPTGILILLLFLSMPAATAWGGETHKVVTDASIHLLCGEEYEFYSQYASEIVRFSTLPDEWRNANDPRGDIIYHLSYATGYGKAPEAVEEWYTKLVNHIREEKYHAAAMDAGVVSHYLGDSLCALHTDSYVDVHVPIERYINDTISQYTVQPYSPKYVEDVKTYVVEASLNVHDYYAPMVEIGENETWVELQIVVGPQLQMYAQIYADLLHSAYVDALENPDTKDQTEREDDTQLIYALIVSGILIMATIYLKKR